MKKFIFLIILLLPSVCSAQNYVMVVVNKNECQQSRQVEQYFRDTDVKNSFYTARKIEKVTLIYGNDNPLYLKTHKIKWYPTTIKFSVQKDGSWLEVERAVGSQDKNFWIRFMGGKVEAKVQAPAIQYVQPPVYIQPQQYSSSSVCGPSG